MKFKEIINNIVRHPEKNVLCIYSFAEYNFGFDYIDESKNNRLTSFWYRKWLCMDTWVGSQAYFFDNELVAISDQIGRKYDPEYKWVSKQAFHKVKSYVETLCLHDQTHINVLTDEDLNKECDLGYRLEYSSQLLTNLVLYKGSVVVVVEKYDLSRDIDKWNKVKIKCDGKEFVVDMQEILVPYDC